MYFLFFLSMIHAFFSFSSCLTQILSADDNQIYPIDCSFFINAAGPWAGEVAKMAGIGTSEEYPVALPVEPR